MDRRIPLRSRAPLYQPDTSQYVISTQPSIGGKRVRRRKPVKDRGVKKSRYYTRAAKSGKIVYDTKEAKAARNLYRGRRQTGGRQTYAQQAANEVGRQAFGQPAPQPPIIINQGEANVANERLVNLVAQGFRYVAEQNRPQPQQRQEPNIQFLRRQQRPERLAEQDAIRELARLGQQTPRPIRLPPPPQKEEGDEDILVEPAQPATPVEPLVQEVEQLSPTPERGGDERYGLRHQQKQNYAESEQSSGDSSFVEEVKPRGRLIRGKSRVEILEEEADLDRLIAQEEQGLRAQLLAGGVLVEQESVSSVPTQSPSESEGSVYREAVEEGRLWAEEEKRKKRRGVFLREAVQKGKGILASAFTRKEPEGAVFFDNPFEEAIIDRGRGIDRVNPLQEVGGLEGGAITYNPAASLSGISFETESQDIAFD